MGKVVLRCSLAVCAALCLGTAPAQEAPYDLLIRNGKIVDGAGNPWYVGDVAIRNDRIERRQQPHPIGRRCPGDALVRRPVPVHFADAGARQTVCRAMKRVRKVLAPLRNGIPQTADETPEARRLIRPISQVAGSNYSVSESHLTLVISSR